ncbi:hypothetical protein AX14_005057 [Amanita brunnescens Koide BX004]|nr:hypothetical protein AX14_005057 [Amanita brunnescens Koide BX004]
MWRDFYGWCLVASSFDAEMCAIKRALEFVITCTSYQNIILVIDNKAAANALFNFDVKSSQMAVIRINKLLLSWLPEDRTRHLTIRFALSHMGISGNERADHLTKAGLKLCLTNP